MKKSGQGRKRNWTSREDRIIRMKTLSVPEMARRIGRSAGAIYQRRHVLDRA